LPNPKQIRQIKYLIFLPLATIMFFLSTSPAVMAQDELTLSVKVGLDSFAKESMTVPIQVIVDNQGPVLDAELQVIYSTWQRDHTSTIPVQLPRQSRKQIPVYISIQSDPRLVINLVDQQGEIRAKKTVNFQKLSANDFLVGVLSSNGSLLNSLAGLGTSSNRRIAVAHLEIADLPETLQGWSALDMLIFNDIDSAQLSTVQRDLLRHWLYAGGRLVIGGGPNAAQTLAGLSNILPYENIENVILPHPIPELDPLHSLPLEDRGPYVATNLSGSILSNPQAASIAAQDNLPLITSLSRGEGEIIYIAFDLSLAPMDTLLTQKASLKQLFRQLEPRSFSFLDLPGGTDQIETSMSLIPGLSLPRPWTIALYLIAYIILVGPLNYLILGRFKKREWMWGTIPLIILIFCGIGYARGYGLSGRQIILRQLTVINGQADNAQVTGMPKRAQPVSPLLIPIAIDTTADNTEREPEIDRSLAEYNTFVGVFSTQRAKYKITIDDAPLAQPLSSYNQELNISYGEPTTITDLYGEIGSMPIALARGQLAMPDVDAQLRGLWKSRTQLR